MQPVNWAYDLVVALATGLGKAQSFWGMYDARVVRPVVDTASLRQTDSDKEIRLEAAGSMFVRYGVEAEGEWSESEGTEPVTYRVTFSPGPSEQPSAALNLVAFYSGVHDRDDELHLRPADGRGPDLVAAWTRSASHRHVVFEVVRQSRRQ